MSEDKIMDPGPTEEHLDVLRKYFGHSQFRPMQWKIIRTVIEDKCDQCVVMATGYGKSLCYQYPAVYTGGVVIVISPLISLMHDQVLSLEVSNIPACFLGSSQQKKSTVFEAILNNEYRIIYATPEFCCGDYGSSVLQKFSSSLNIVLIAIDEAHCVSQWGFDFRPSYRKLSILKDMFPYVPLLSVTATATLQVCRDICSSLNLRNPQVIRTDFDRPNLYLGVSLKSNDIFGDVRQFLKRSGLKWTFPGSTIIYCPTKKMAETVSSVLTDNAVKCSVYHAELSMKKREEVHNQFVKDKIQVIAATVAFGMGIDKPDIRLVIHYGAPKDIESYYQEIGRAGRDGLPSTCHVFYSSSDFRINQYFLSNLSGKYREHRMMVFKFMEKYLNSQDCRWDLIILYFDPGKKSKRTEGVNCRSNCCDNCKNRLLNKGSSKNSSEKNHIDLISDALLLLQAVQVFNSRKGLTVPIYLLRGSRNQRLPVEYYKHKLFGAGKHKSEAWWKALGRLLLLEELLVESGNIFKGRSFVNLTTVAITPQGRNFLMNPKEYSVTLKPSNELIKLAKYEPSNCYSSSKPVPQQSKTMLYNEAKSEKVDVKLNVSNKQVRVVLSKEESELMFELYYGLMKLRNELASKFGCMPYMIANNKMLMDLAKNRPKTKEELSKVEGFARNKVDKFGEEFINEIDRLVKNFKSKPEGSSDVNNDNELNEDSFIELQSKSLADEDKIWGEDDDSFLMNASFEVLPDFKYDNDCVNNKDELWPDLDLSTIEENFEEKIADVCENTVTPSVSATNDDQKQPLLANSKSISDYSSVPIKRKNAMLKYECSDDSDSDISDDESSLGTQKLAETSDFSKKSSSSSVKSSPYKKKVITSVISKKPLPDWINRPDAKKMLNKKLKTNSLFKF